jgi:hypothetical protein
MTARSQPFLAGDAARNEKPSGGSVLCAPEGDGFRALTAREATEIRGGAKIWVPVGRAEDGSLTWDWLDV